MAKGIKEDRTKRRLLSGRSHKAPVAEVLRLPTIDDLTCPSMLKGESANRWNELAPALRDSGLLTAANLATFILHCRSWGDLLRAQSHIDEEGDMVKGARGDVVRNPWYVVYNQALQTFLTTSAAFGLTPSSLARVKSTSPERQLSLAEYLELMVKGTGSPSDSEKDDDHAPK